MINKPCINVDEFLGIKCVVLFFNIYFPTVHGRSDVNWPRIRNTIRVVCFVFVFFFYLGPINAIAISPNDEIITGSNDSTLRVWSLSSGECQAVYDGHMSSVLCLVLTCDGESVISGSEDKTVKAWHLKTKSCATFKGHSGKLEKNS